MGVSEKPLLLPLKSQVQGSGAMSKPSGSLLNITLEAQVEKRSDQGATWNSGGRKSGARSDRSRRLFMKRRARLEDSRRASNGIGRRVRTLKKLIPRSESMGTLDGLLKETADYILSLQMRVRVMQIMVNALTGSPE